MAGSKVDKLHAKLMGITLYAIRDLKGKEEEEIKI